MDEVYRQSYLERALFVFSNKAYAVFALLFGFSFYIQDNNQQRRGKDFRLRFIWRMVLLFIIGQFNAAFLQVKY